MKILYNFICSAATVFCLLSGGAYAQSEIENSGTPGRGTIESAEASYKFIANILQTFRSTGRLVNNPGIDGADLEAFLGLLDTYYDEFSSGFDLDSAMCQFYMDPENSRMTIEGKAELSFSFLRNLDDRIERYIAVDREFQEMIELEFGSILLENINQAKFTAKSNRRLPATEFDGAAVINFIDSTCM